MRPFIKIILISANILSLFFLQTAPVSGETYLILASFSTSVADQPADVKQNIIMACNRLNGVMIAPKKSFSFNDTVGEGSAKNGFADGLVLYRDGARMEPGGGLCQVSSTLFNAFLMAGLTIAERHRHFQPVTYVPPGLDATIKYGKKDLRITNPHDQRIVIRADMNDKNITAIIYGEKKLIYSYVIDTESEEVQLPIGEDSGRVRPGIMIHVYRKKFRENSFIESSLLYRDFYPPVFIE